MNARRIIASAFTLAVVVATCVVSFQGGSPTGAAPPDAARQTAAQQTAAPARPKTANRSPVDLVLSPDGSWIATANQTSDSVSLVDVADGRVLDEQPVGRHPVSLALSSDGKRLLVSGSYSGDVTLLEVAGGKLKKVGSIATGFEPFGVAIAPDGKTGYVSLAAAAQVAVLDLDRLTVTGKIDVGRWPHFLALTPDGSRLAVGTSGDRGITVVDTAARKELFQEQFLALNIGHLQMSPDGKKVYFPWLAYRLLPISPQNIRMGWVLGTRIGRVNVETAQRREAMSLDPQGKAVGDPFGIGVTPDQSRLVSSASGTHELLVYRMSDIPLSDYGNLDHINPQLLRDRDRFDRIPLGGRPMGLRIAADSRTVYVANYLDNSIQVVDLEKRELARSIPLGGDEQPTLARRGEAIFYDAERSLDQWYSCHSCHYEGGTNVERMDTWNDGTPNTYKTVLSLHRLHETGPWTWHGWQKDLRDAMKSSLTGTMQGPEPTAEDVDALLAYLKDLEPPPNPFRRPDGSLTDAAARGKAVFESKKAGCSTCHSGPNYTDGQVHDVGLGSATDRYQGFNTPSLRDVYRKVRLLHDGRARSLEQVLTGAHDPAKVTGQGALTDDERSDLIEYLKSL